MVPESNILARGPVRTCVGCRRRAARGELLRVVAREGFVDQESWSVVPDPRRRAPGRGAHLHPTTDCLDRAVRTRAFARALRHDAQSRGPLDTERLRQHLDETTGTTSTPTRPDETGSTSS